MSRYKDIEYAREQAAAIKKMYYSIGVSIC